MIGAAKGANAAYKVAQYAAYALPAVYAAAKNLAAYPGLGVGSATMARTAMRRKYPGKRPVARTKVGRRIGTAFKFRRPTSTINKRKRKRVLQASAYHCKYYKRTHGAKRSRAYLRNRVVDTGVTDMRLRHSNMSDWSADNPATGALSGALYLKFAGGRDNNAALTTMPIKLFNLFGTQQGGTTATPMWELVYNSTSNTYQWFNGYGLDQTGAARAAWMVEDKAGNPSSNAIIRRYGVIKWSRTRLQFYGKTSHPTRIVVQLVKFLEDEYAPEYYGVSSGYTNGMTNKAKELWNQQCKPLLNNPIASQIRLAKPAMKVLKEYVIEIDPTKTTENDADVNRRVLDIFNRWNRVVNFTASNSNSDSSTLANLDNANVLPAVGTGYQATPNRPTDAVYVLIKSMQPLKIDDVAGVGAATPVNTASMDWNVQTCWKTIET